MIDAEDVMVNVIHLSFLSGEEGLGGNRICFEESG